MEKRKTLQEEKAKLNQRVSGMQKLSKIYYS